MYFTLYEPWIRLADKYWVRTPRWVYLVIEKSILILFICLPPQTATRPDTGAAFIMNLLPTAEGTNITCTWIQKSMLSVYWVVVYVLIPKLKREFFTTENLFTKLNTLYFSRWTSAIYLATAQVHNSKTWFLHLKVENGLKSLSRLRY